MFRVLFLPLINQFTFFNILQYISFRAVSAAITALFLSLLLGPFAIRKLRVLKFGQEIRIDGPKNHLKKSGTPTMGGLLTIFSVVLSILLWQNFNSIYTWLVTIAIIGFGFLGFLDDYLKIKKANSDGLHAKFKLGGQIVISFIIMFIMYHFRKEHTTLLYIPFMKEALLDLSFMYIPFGMLLLVSTSNAVNLADGLDGLATGLVLIALVPFTIIAYISGRIDFASYLYIPYIGGTSELTVVSMSMIGGSLGFLWFNSHPAQIMMGDTGSLALGGVLGILALVLKKELLLLVIGGVFVIETLSVIIQVFWFKKTARRVFKMAPLHHHFELKGWHENKVVTRFWILGILLSFVGLALLKTQ